MTDLATAIRQAWQRVAPILQDDQHNLAKRIARKRTPTLTRPPRAWCIALRASDNRIRSAHHEIAYDDDTLQQITLTADKIKRLIEPVRFPAPGITTRELAELLGTTPIGLRNARLDHTLRTHHIKGLGGVRGRPVPIVYTDKPLDPCSKHFANPDRAWLWTTNILAGRLPPDLRVTLTRIPRFSPHVGRHAYDPDRHPELDAVSAKSESKRLPPPQLDLACWYKWSRSGYYLGDDPSNWRKSFQDLGERPARYRPKKKYKRRPRKSTSAGSLHFNGYQWQCPTCQRTCRTIYYALPPMNLLKEIPRLAQIVDIPRKVTGFACHKCHRIRFFTRTTNDAWNQLIAYLTAGLLYGSEVKRPEWFTNDRKRPYKPHSNPRPATRRAQVLELLLEGHARPAIAAMLKMKIPALTQQINKIYKSERLKGQRALLMKYKKPVPARLVLRRDRIHAMLKSSHTINEIARELNIKPESVERHIRDLKRANQVPRIISPIRATVY